VAHTCNPQEAEIRRITVQSQPRKTHHNKRDGGVAQDVGPDYCKKKNAS
jgi:hypothetical protein